MKPALRHLFVCALLLVVGFGAQAQGDEVLERYGLSLVNLSESVRLLETDVAASRDELDSAAGALRFLATEAGNPSLIEALERVFVRARTAIANRSATDLAVQNELIRGGFQRAVFESALDLLETEPAAAQARLARLATDLGWSQEARDQLAAATGRDAVRRLFEATVADGVARKLGTVEGQYSESQDAAYRTLASAYGDFLLIQDSPRVDSQTNGQFGTAATSLVENRTEELGNAVASLSTGFGQLAQAARAQPTAPAAPAAEGSSPAAEGSAAASSPEAASESPAAAENAPQPAAEADGQQDDPASERSNAASQRAASEPEQAAAATGEPSTQVAEMPSVTLGQAQANQAVPAGSAGTDAAAGQDRTASAGSAVEDAQQPDSERAAAIQALRVELIAAGVAPRTAADVATKLIEQEVTSLSTALDDLYAQAGRVVAAVQAGEGEGARNALQAFSASYQAQLQPALELISPAVDDRLTDLTAALTAVPAVRAQDALVLLGQVDAVANLLAGEPSSNVQIVNTQATMLWAGWVRVATLIALALLAIVPLYLLNLAFGGGNRNWQLIGVALFLLLLPLIYEGLASAGAVAARYSGIEALAIPLAFSMFHNPIAQVVWAAITAAAILFAVAGLYGICVQFGLLGSRRATVSDSQTIRSTAVVPDADTVVDWDEEF